MGPSKCITAYRACASSAPLPLRTTFRRLDEAGRAARETGVMGVRYRAPAGNNPRKEVLSDSPG